MIMSINIIRDNIKRPLLYFYFLLPIREEILPSTFANKVF